MVNSTTTIKRNDYCHRVTSQIQLYLFHCILIRLYMLTFLHIKPFLEGPMSLFSFLSDSRRNRFEFFFRTHLSVTTALGVCIVPFRNQGFPSYTTPRYGTKRKRRPTRICTIKRLLFVSPSSTFIPVDNHVSPPRADPSYRIKRRKKTVCYIRKYKQTTRPLHFT